MREGFREDQIIFINYLILKLNTILLLNTLGTAFNANSECIPVLQMRRSVCFGAVGQLWHVSTLSLLQLSTLSAYTRGLITVGIACTGTNSGSLSLAVNMFLSLRILLSCTLFFSILTDLKVTMHNNKLNRKNLLYVFIIHCVNNVNELRSEIFFLLVTKHFYTYFITRRNVYLLSLPILIFYLLIVYIGLNVCSIIAVLVNYRGVSYLFIYTLNIYSMFSNKYALYCYICNIDIFIIYYTPYLFIINCLHVFGNDYMILMSTMIVIFLIVALEYFYLHPIVENVYCYFTTESLIRSILKLFFKAFYSRILIFTNYIFIVKFYSRLRYLTCAMYIKLVICSGAAEFYSSFCIYFYNRP